MWCSLYEMPLCRWDLLVTTFTLVSIVCIQSFFPEVKVECFIHTVNWPNIQHQVLEMREGCGDMSTQWADDWKIGKQIQVFEIGHTWQNEIFSAIEKTCRYSEKLFLVKGIQDNVQRISYQYLLEKLTKSLRNLIFYHHQSTWDSYA